MIPVWEYNFQRVAPFDARRPPNSLNGLNGWRGDSMSVLRILSSEGDTRYAWDRVAVEAHDAEAEAAVLEAERIFASARRGGATAFDITNASAPTQRYAQPPA